MTMLVQRPLSPTTKPSARACTGNSYARAWKKTNRERAHALITSLEIFSWSSSDKLVVLLLRIRSAGGSDVGLCLALLAESHGHGFALVVKDLVLILDKLDSLALLELLDRLGKSNVEDLAAVGWAALGIERVGDTSIDWRRWGLVEVGGRGGRVVRYCNAFEHVLLASYLVAALESGNGAFGLAALDVVVPSAG